MKSLLAVVGAACLLAAGACGSGGVDDANAAADPARLSLPQQVLGLVVTPEDIQGQLEEIERPYVDSVAVFSLREEDLLRASLQVARFNRAARPEDSSFRQSIVSTIGGSAPQEYRVGDGPVYATTASDQIVFTWFEDDGMFVLGVQKDFEFPRTLLRRLIESDLTV